MNETHAAVVSAPGVATHSKLAPSAAPRSLWYALAAVAILFAEPLVALTRFALTSDRYSHILLIPLISGYAAWQLRGGLTAPGARARGLSTCLIALGVLALAGYAVVRIAGVAWHLEDALALGIAGFVSAFAGGCGWSLSTRAFRSLAFSLGMLVFMAPLPVAAMTLVETFMQHGSAAVAHLFFGAAGTTVFYHDLTFQLPGINLLVAPECSGIRSTLALLIVSIVTGYFFLRSPWNCAILALAVVPLALLRNGFRIFTIGELCVHVGPDMIDSFLHRRGGPIFFALSLIPFFALLAVLLRREARSRKPRAAAPPPQSL